jgi:uncharacterized protein (UPF0297 family)
MKGKFGKEDLFNFALVVGVFFLGYYMYISRDILAVKRALASLPKNLQEIYKTLKAKGYNPETSPKAFSGNFVSFKRNDIDVIINENEVVTFLYDPEKPPFVAQYKNGIMHGNNLTIADSDIVSAILQIIENRDYEK